MLRNLLLLLCLTTAMSATAQDGKSAPSKTTENKNDPQIDYKQMGAPMPELLFRPYEDTTTNNDTAGKQKNETVAAVATHSKKAQKEAIAQKAAKTNVDSRAPKKFLTNADFDNGKPLMVMMFNPTCSHCQDETIMLENNMDFFSTHKVILLANKIMEQYLHDFAAVFTHVDKYPAISLGIDEGHFIDSVFLYQSLPQINIYNAQRKLIKSYSGEVPVDSLKKYMQ